MSETETYRPDGVRASKIKKALRGHIPLASYADFKVVQELALAKGKRSLHPNIATWLAATSYIRHEYTDYDQLLEEGYQQEAARFFVRETINEKLVEWGSTRVISEVDEREILAEYPDID